MSRRNIFYIIATALIVILAYLGYKGYEVYTIKKKSADNIQNLPDLSFQFLKPLHSGSDKKKIINYFSSDCEHCLFMTEQIIKHKDQLNNSEILMITADNLEKAQNFQRSYGIDSLDFINIGVDTSHAFMRLFGSTAIPSFYIYDEAGRLTSSYKGEIKIEKLIDSIK
ncbi:TlpA family protein disulfide reductase [Dyadobacter crusticola]|uniref:TlpA family protein disulfide reductase n=1 Tax=Dyadobacter crusticola TaxID=292407 RepID=UPI0004E22FE5|nr:TlpA disulfide reductase family protein [Dyadobacter crusticola]